MTSEDSSSNPGASSWDHAFGTILSSADVLEKHQGNCNMAESGFAAVAVNGPRIAVTFYQPGSMNPVHTIRFAKER